MIKEMNEFNAYVRQYTVDVWYNYYKNNELNFDMWYQRPYVWTEKEQNEFLSALFKGFPCGSIAVIADEYNEQFYEIVDGKQRLTTLMLFIDNKISYNNMYFKDLEIRDQRYINHLQLPAYELNYSTEEEKLKYFYSINFTGVPQSEDHKSFILQKMGEL